MDISVGIIMGSRSDWSVMEAAANMLDALGIRYECKVVSAHRTPDRLYAYAREARGRGLKAIIAGAGGGSSLTRYVCRNDSGAGSWRAGRCHGTQWR
jgi:5-(carboxyamino)imidazole ribonucleotide mutase